MALQLEVTEAAPSCTPDNAENAARRFSGPHWIPAYIPELDGLRGIAAIAVFFYHARGRLLLPWMAAAAAWGWAGVNLFFVLSGYLITSILLHTREEPRHYFRNFYARRILRIWPVYFLLIAICFLGPKWLLQLPEDISRREAFAVALLFLQSIVPAQIFEFGAAGPTWSLAIEEQYYLLWAPVVRYVRSQRSLAVGLLCVLIASPVLRLAFAGELKTTHMLLHIDSIVVGSLIPLALRGIGMSRRRWMGRGAAGALSGFLCLAAWAKGTVFADSALAAACGGTVLLAIAGTGSGNLLLGSLRRAPLRFFGRISYGFYMTHVAVLMSLGNLYRITDRAGLARSVTVNFLVVAVQFALTTLVVTCLWYGLESRMLRLKRYFQ